MNLSKLSIKFEYRSLNDNIIDDFLNPALSNSILYRRSVGFFTSTSLVYLSRGMENLFANNGKVELVVSPRLSEEDITAIELGYEKREDIISSSLISSLKDPIDSFEEDRLNMLANMIAQEKLDIKVALLEENNKIGMYHEKLGILKDPFGNYITFSGSMNESSTAFNINYETIDVFCSWKPGESDRASLKNEAFNRIWNNKEKNIIVKDYPILKNQIIKKYKKHSVSIKNLKLDTEQNTDINIYPNIPEHLEFHKYQLKAIDNWEKNEYRGIFNMATGTGKTFTALGALTRLSKKLNNNLNVIIVCPFQHLVEQWVDDLAKFNISPIIGYSASSHKNWEKDLKDAIRRKSLKLKHQEFICFITTNASFMLDRVQSKIKQFDNNSLIIVDEAHNFGTPGLLNSLPKHFNFRLGLSATIERHFDEDGTNALFKYFGKESIVYTLSQAIQDGFLVDYLYIPVIISLTESELSKYFAKSKQIKREVRKDKNNNIVLSKAGQFLAIERSRIIAGAVNKINALMEVIEPYKNDSHILVYCGSTSIIDYEETDQSEVILDDERQITLVTHKLGNELGMRVSKFTSQESIEQRKSLTKDFADGSNLQALIAIKCLDEGVNIPEIKTAFILASTTNPKEYIQRRGRVLRTSKNKEMATIFDFVTIPKPLNEAQSLTNEQRELVDSLINNELKRMEEFAGDAINTAESLNIINSIKEAYYI